MRNYIEIEHDWSEDAEHERPDGTKTVTHERSVDVWHAVRPSSSQWAYWSDEEAETNPDAALPNSTFGGGNAWTLNGTTLTVYTKHDIAGLRKLLDAIEAELDSADETVVE